jgi:hypothetical protein
MLKDNSCLVKIFSESSMTEKGRNYGLDTYAKKLLKVKGKRFARVTGLERRQDQEKIPGIFFLDGG